MRKISTNYASYNCPGGLQCLNGGICRNDVALDVF